MEGSEEIRMAESAGAYRIPQRIIQTANALPEALRLRGMMEAMRRLHPDWEFMFFDEPARQRFIDAEFPQYRAVYDGFRVPIQRYDFFRYLAVYRHGGFYFDLDILLAENLSPLLEHGCVFPFERLTLSRFLRAERGMDWEVGNYAFGAAARHPFLEAVIENCVRGQREPEWVRPMLRGLPPPARRDFYVIYSTGPGLVTRTLAEHPELAKTVTALFPEDVCDEASWNRFGDYGVHLMEGGWRRKRGPFMGRVERIWVDWLRSRLIKESRKLGKTRQLPTA